MRLGTIANGVARCLLCGCEASDDNPDQLERALRQHLSAVHARIMVSREDVNRRGVERREFHGVRWPNELRLQ
jgi:hypothetical protein